MRDLAVVEEVAERRERISPWTAEALHATLGLPGEPPRSGEPLPPLWRWFSFRDAPRRSALGPAGAPVQNGIFGGGAPFLISGRFEFSRSLIVGRSASLIRSCERRRRLELGDGPVEIQTHRIDVGATDGPAEIEERDYLRRVGGADPSPPLLANAPAPNEPRRKARWRTRMTTDGPLLFRIGALLFDADRLHYDIDYCRHAGLSGLVVQTQLLALLLIETAREKGPDRTIARFSYRLRGVLTHLEPFAVCGRPTQLEDGDDGAELWIESETAPRRVVMTATLSYV